MTNAVERRRTYREQKRASGLCFACGKAPAFVRGTKEYTRCAGCLRRNAAAQIARIRQKQK